MLDLHASGGMFAEFASLIPQLRRVVLLQAEEWRFLFIDGRVVGRRAALDLRRVLADRTVRSATLWSMNRIEEVLDLGPPVDEMLLQMRKFAFVQVDGRGFLFVWGRIVGETEHDEWTRIVRSGGPRSISLRCADHIEDLVELGPSINELLLRACGDLDLVA